MPRIGSRIYSLFKKFGSVFRRTGFTTSVFEKRKRTPDTAAKLARHKFAKGPASKLFVERRREDKPISHPDRRTQ